MYSKKNILALALFGCIFFTANASNIIDLDTQIETSVDLKKVKVPRNG